LNFSSIAAQKERITGSARIPGESRNNSRFGCSLASMFEGGRWSFAQGKGQAAGGVFGEPIN